LLSSWQLDIQSTEPNWGLHLTPLRGAGEAGRWAQMPHDDSNPHVLDFTPGSWDLPFRRWVLGALAPCGLLAYGLSAVLSQTATVPTAGGRMGGFRWIEAHGWSAITWGVALIGFALLMHGRYHWRYRDLGWMHYEAIQGIGALIGVLGLAVTYAQLIVMVWS